MTINKNAIFGVLVLLVVICLLSSNGVIISYGAEGETFEPQSILHVGSGQTYSSIQDAIDNTSDGDTVFVHTGFYVENLNITKALTLEGENKENTVLNNSGQAHNINISADYVTVFNFTINNDLVCIPNDYEYNNSFRNIYGCGDYLTIHDLECYNVGPSNRAAGGIQIGPKSSEDQGKPPFCNHTMIYNNYIEYGEGGVSLSNGWYGEVFNNTVNTPMTEAIPIAICQRNGTRVYDNDITSGGMGITISFNCTNNELYRNSVSTSGLFGLMLLHNNEYGEFANNMIYQNDFSMSGFYKLSLNLNPAYNIHDNFVFNNNFTGGMTTIMDGYSPSTGVRFWYNYSTGGNYWDGYSGSDNNRGPDQDMPGDDGIGDSAYAVNANFNDNYPRVGPWNGTKVAWDDGSPSIFDEYPQHETSDVNISEDMVIVTLSDENDTLDWSIEGDHINNAYGFGPDGTKWATLSTPLPYGSTITWYVNVSDGYNSTNEVYTFDTESPNVVYVDDDADPSWYDSIHLDNIPDAIDTISNNGTIHVYNGTYNLTDELYIDRPMNLLGENKTKTIIQRTGSKEHRLLTIEDLWDNYSRIENFTFQGGYANMTNRNGIGGNILIVNSLNATVNNSIIKDGFAEQYGGGIQLEAGGNLKNSTVYDCDVLNSGMNGGGGISMRYGGNIAEYCYITNCSGPVGGGILLKMGAYPPNQNQIIHCTIANNTAYGYLGAYYGGGIASQGSGWTTSEIHDSIIYHNSPNNIMDVDGSLNIYYSCMTPLWGGSGNNNTNGNPNFLYVGNYYEPSYYSIDGTSSCWKNASDSLNRGAWQPLNQAPFAPILISPPHNSDYEDVYHKNLIVNVTDPDGGLLDIYYYWNDSTLIGVKNNISSGTNCSLYLPNYTSPGWINHTSLYSWYVVVDDGTETTQGPTWNFSTCYSWDVTVDKIVNALDVSVVVTEYGLNAQPGELYSDIVEDGDTDALDVSSVVTHYGEDYDGT